MIKFLTVILTCTLFLSLNTSSTLANGKCADLFRESTLATINQPQLDATDNLIAYLGELLGEQIIGDKELNRFIDGLEQGKLINPISERQSKIHTQAQIQRGGIEGHFKNDLNKERLLEWARKSLKEKKRVKEKRGETRQKTYDASRKMEFKPIPPGSFLMGDPERKVTVNLTHPIEMTTTQVTQGQWLKVMGKNPSKFSKGEHSIDYYVNGESIEIQPDHPVENMTWWSVLVFANRLSKKHGLKPVYNLSGIQFIQGTKAENGTLSANDGQELKIKIDPIGYYESEGYRLPTEAEQEYILRDRGQQNGTYSFGDNEAELKDYAWYSENADRKTHPVGELKPLIIDGNKFYDLHGNVSEWSWTYYADNLMGGINPLGPKWSAGRVIRGGDWLQDARRLRSAYSDTWGPGEHFASVGFRLVRTTDVKPAKDAPDPEVTE